MSEWHKGWVVPPPGGVETPPDEGPLTEGK